MKQPRMTPHSPAGSKTGLSLAPELLKDKATVISRHPQTNTSVCIQIDAPMTNLFELAKFSLYPGMNPLSVGHFTGSFLVSLQQQPHMVCLAQQEKKHLGNSVSATHLFFKLLE